MAKTKHPEPIIVKPEDVDPRHDWNRPLMALGQMAVDFEERVDFRRLHRYRLGRTRQALAKSGLGAILTFDQHNIRYISSTVIGEWAPDNLSPSSPLTRTPPASPRRGWRTTIAAPACSACAGRSTRGPGCSAAPPRS